MSGGDIDPGDVVDVLSGLVDKSLVDVDPSADRTRYRLLETIRQYAEERLEASGETAIVRNRHLEHYLEWAETAGPHLRGREQLMWSAALARDTDNFRAALDWAVNAHLPDEGLRLVVPLMVTGIPTRWTATDWANTARSIPGAEGHELFPLAVAYAAMGATLRGELDRAETLVATAQQAQQRLGTQHLWIHAAAGTLAFFQADLEQARQHAERWVELAYTQQDTYEIAHALILLATALQPEPARAVVVAEEATRVARNAGITSALLYSLFVLSSASMNDDPARALALLDEAVNVGTMLGDRQAAATAMAARGHIAIERNDWRTALRAYADAAEQHLQAGQSLAFRATLRFSTVAFAGIHRFEPVGVIIGATDARLPIQYTLNSEWQTKWSDAEAAALDALGGRRFDELKARGAQLTLADTVAYLRTEADDALAELDDAGCERL